MFPGYLLAGMAGRLAVSPVTQIWHLSVQMAQKSCRFTGKTFQAGDLGHYTGNLIVRQNASFSPAA
jgi:hypothetical protein